jgi:RHS repeat-associated protein
MRVNLKHLRVLAALVLASMVFSAHATPTTSYFVYDEAGHVIGEYDSSGNPIQEHIYLGNRPVAVAVTQSGTTNVDYVTTDQLNTPRVVTDSGANILWSWNSDPFGNGQSTATSLNYNLRFPGQYFDAETGHNYNYFRDYDPTMGRYLESDPIGLQGGINTYLYVRDNPITLVDPKGKNIVAAAVVVVVAAALYEGYEWWNKYIEQIECQKGCKNINQCPLQKGDTAPYQQCVNICILKIYGGGKSQPGPIVGN